MILLITIVLLFGDVTGVTLTGASKDAAPTEVELYDQYNRAAEDPLTHNDELDAANDTSWTEINATTNAEISSSFPNEAVQPGGNASWQAYVNKDLGCDDQWICLKHVSRGPFGHIHFLFRVDTATGEAYTLGHQDNVDAVQWNHFDGTLTGDNATTVQIEISSPLPHGLRGWTEGNYHCARVTGTGTSTNLKWWEFTADPGAYVDDATWDGHANLVDNMIADCCFALDTATNSSGGAGSFADCCTGLDTGCDGTETWPEFTADPGANAVDTGTYVGLIFDGGAGRTISDPSIWDDFRAGCV